MLNGGGGWGIFNSLFGWQNSATYGSVISYNLYWVAVILMFLAMWYNEKHGHWPLRKPKYSTRNAEHGDNSSGKNSDGVLEKSTKAAVPASSNVKEVTEQG